MIVVMERGATQAQVDNVVARLKEFGFEAHLSAGVERTVIGAIGEKTPDKIERLEATPGVEKIVPILQPYKLAGREFRPTRSVVEVAGVAFGGTRVPVIAGPCAVESEAQLLASARLVKRSGGSLLRGGAFKPRTSPYSFQGLAEDGLKILAAARAETGLGVVTEVVNPRDVELVDRYADMFQIGARNMQNFTLLTEVGRTRKPVLLKRGLSATIQEWLMAAEYVMAGGNYSVILCERGIRTFETETRNTFDLSAVAAAHDLSHLPVIADPSHGTGKRKYVTPMARAAVAAGADGLIVEMHPEPEAAMSDGPQSLNPEEFDAMMQSVRRVAAALDREV
ncbi:MAG TPA: 3-deoxy-7-phosphoheptulonate synthase [Limnochordia bacterium]|nr:3-deoxy-7-phosphoheptulonate synthase [Limnochordia bacterium]